MRALLSLSPLIACACNFIDLRPVNWTAFPQPEAVLSSENEKVGIIFDTDMDKVEAENAFSVTSQDGNVSGDISWEGRAMCFVPPAGWKAGVRYMLNFQGTVTAVDGREAKAALFIPFYAPSATARPYLVSASPADGAQVGVAAETGAALRLEFSCAMSRQSVEDALTVSGFSEKIFSWSADDAVVTVTPKKQISPWTLYKWSLSTEARSVEGSPLVREASGTFVTGEDSVPPEIVEVCPLIPASTAAGRWQKTGLDFETGFGPGNAAGIIFSEPVSDAALSAVRTEPSLQGRCERWTDSAIVFIPAQNPEPEIVYTLVVSEKAADVSGLAMAGERRFRFVADIPYLAIVQLDAGNIIMPDGVFPFSIQFSQSFTQSAKANAVLNLRLEAFFPGTLLTPTLRTARWLSDSSLYLEWEGASPSQFGEPHWYRLVLPGGRSGIANGSGSYFKEDVSFIKEAVE